MLGAWELNSLTRDIFTIKIQGFDLEKTLENGQCFRWIRQDEYWEGIVEGSEVQVSQISDFIYVKDRVRSPEYWLNYFDLCGSEYSLIDQEIPKDGSYLRRAVDFSRGMTILRQSSWEALISFIISQNNNIPRIKYCIEKLCDIAGKDWVVFESDRKEFPSAQMILDHAKEIEEAGFLGYRYNYVIHACKLSIGKNLSEIRCFRGTAGQVVEHLRMIKGVGPKVANCVALYGYHKLEAFPIDVWIKRILDREYPAGFPYLDSKYAGVLQQYMFYYERFRR